MPCYAVARLLGSEAFSTWPGSVFAALAAATAVVLLVLALSALVPINVALIAGLVVALASPVWTVAANGPWPHTVDVLLIAGALHALSRKRLWFAGCWLALLVPTRPLLAVAVAVAVLGAVLSLRQRSPRPLLAIGAPSFVGLLVLRVVSCLTLPGLGRFSYGESSCAGADAA